MTDHTGAMTRYITTPIYYVNAKPHVGTAYTTVAADVLARFYRQQGDDVLFITGIAEHGQKISQRAYEEGLAPLEFGDRNEKYFRLAWQSLNISYDDFLRTTEPRHEKAVRIFFEKLKSSGKIYEGQYEGLYCVGHEAFLKESELDEEGKCPDHQTKPEKVEEQNWFFKLSDYEDILREKIVNDEIKISPQSRKNEILSFLEQGLEDIAISRQNVEWAFQLPWDQSQTIYVWLDELFSYCTAAGYGQDEEKFNKHWPPTVHLVGKDIIKFHCLIWPALLLAIEEPLPREVFANGFFTVNGQKISKSLGNIIDPNDLVTEYGADAVRYHLLRDIPFGSDGDFSLERLEERYNADLANGLGNLVSRTLTLAEQHGDTFDFATPLPTEVEKLLAQVEQLMVELAFAKALTTIWSAISWADEYLEKKKPWQLKKEGKDNEAREVIQDVYQVLLEVNKLLAPFLPATHEKIVQLLAARPLIKPKEPLFARKE